MQKSKDSLTRRDVLMRSAALAAPWPAANPQVMRRSHIACHAAALSWLLNRKLHLDPAKEQFIGDDEANGLRSLPSRKIL